jgi:hypothetical protein
MEEFPDKFSKITARFLTESHEFDGNVLEG